MSAFLASSVPVGHPCAVVPAVASGVLPVAIRPTPPSCNCFEPSFPSWDGRCTAVAVVASVVALPMLRRASRKESRRCRVSSVVVAAAPAAVDTASQVKAELAKKEAEYRRRQETTRGGATEADAPALGGFEKIAFVGKDGLLQVPAAAKGVRASVYAIFGRAGGLEYVGVSRNAQSSLRAHFARRPELCADFVIHHILKPDRSLLEATRKAWFAECGVPRGNDSGVEQALWDSPRDVRLTMTPEELAGYDKTMPMEKANALREFALRAEVQRVEAFTELGCDEQLLFDAKLKTKGLLDLDLNAPIGVKRPAGGVGAAFVVMLRAADGSEVKLECPPDVTILDAAETAGIELPSSCKSGACSACAAKVLEGTIDQSDQSYLDDGQIAAGYTLTCVCYPRSDLVLATEKQAEVT